MKARILVTGPRRYANRQRLYQILDAAVEKLALGFLIQGGATGADTLAKEWADERLILCWTCEADWSLGTNAGPIRNRRMLVEGRPDIVIAFMDGAGPGTRNMVRIAREAGVRVIEVDAPAQPS